MPDCCGYHPPIAAPLGDTTTERLLLRRFHRDDIDDFAALFAHIDMWRFPLGRGLRRDETEGLILRQMSAWERCGFGLWATVERATGRLVGYVGLSTPLFLPEVLPHIEVGWRLHPDVWGRGYATEAAVAALDAAFSTLGLAEVCSLPQSDNTASVRVARRLGMRLDRQVNIPANEDRGHVQADLFLTTADEWRLRIGD